MAGDVLWRHLTSEHPGALTSGHTGLPVMSEPDRVEDMWKVYHRWLHRDGYAHDTSGNRPARGTDNDNRTEEDMTGKRQKWVQQTGCICIDPPQHMEDCPGKRGVLVLGEHHGKSILETLWEEMDRLMEGLMTKQDAEDGGDKFRAEELAYCIAVFQNPYAPSVDEIRKQCMERWNGAQAA